MPKRSTTKITQNFAKQLNPDPNRDYAIYDAELPGFGVRVRSTGTKTLILDRARVFFDRSIDELVDAESRPKNGQLSEIMSNGAGDAFDRNVWFASSLRSLAIPAYLEHGWSLSLPTDERVELGRAGCDPCGYRHSGLATVVAV